MRNKLTIAGFAVTLRAIVLLGVAITLFSSLWAEAEVRVYQTSDTVEPGQTKVRQLSLLEPSPYYASSPFAISLVPKAEAPSEKWDITVLRLNILVGSHRVVQGLDIGVLGGFADNKMNGLGIAGIFNSMGESEEPSALPASSTSLPLTTADANLPEYTPALKESIWESSSDPAIMQDG